jgi:hypothetical protein
MFPLERAVGTLCRHTMSRKGVGHSMLLRHEALAFVQEMEWTLPGLVVDEAPAEAAGARVPDHVDPSVTIMELPDSWISSSADPSTQWHGRPVPTILTHHNPMTRLLIQYLNQREDLPPFDPPNMFIIYSYQRALLNNSRCTLRILEIDIKYKSRQSDVKVDFGEAGCSYGRLLNLFECQGLMLAFVQFLENVGEDPRTFLPLVQEYPIDDEHKFAVVPISSIYSCAMYIMPKTWFNDRKEMRAALRLVKSTSKAVLKGQAQMDKTLRAYTRTGAKRKIPLTPLLANKSLNAMNLLHKAAADATKVLDALEAADDQRQMVVIDATLTRFFDEDFHTAKDLPDLDDTEQSRRHSTKFDDAVRRTVHNDEYHADSEQSDPDMPAPVDDQADENVDAGMISSDDEQQPQATASLRSKRRRANQ